MSSGGWQDRILDGHRVGRRLGAALGGDLYEAEQILRTRAVVLKIVDASVAAAPGFEDRFAHDIALLDSFSHPHVVTVIQAGAGDGTHYLATAPVRGPTLAELLAGGVMLDHRRVTDLIAQVAAALDAVHERGLVHRGLSPASIVVSGQEGAEHASITDFAIADDTSLYGGLFDRPSGTAPPPIDYAAPEQVRGEPATARTDVYALGAILFCALTGSPPFSDRSAGATLEAHLNEPVPSVALIDELPDGFDEIFARALAKDPAERYASASQLAVALPDKLRVLATWRSMLVAGTSASAAGAEAPPRPEPAAAAPAEANAERADGDLDDDDLDDDLPDDEDTSLTGETGELPQSDERLDDSLASRALADPEERPPARRRGPRYRLPRNRSRPRKKRPLPDLEPIAVPVRPATAPRRKRSRLPFAAVAVLLLATAASLLAAAGVFDRGDGGGERASVATTADSGGETRALAQLRKDGEQRAARERAARKAAADKAAKQKAATDRAAKQKAAADRAAKQKAATDKAATSKAAADKQAASDKAARERAATRKAKRERERERRAAASDGAGTTGSRGAAGASGSTAAPGDGGAATSTSLRWPAGRSAYTAVIYASSSDRAEALNRARRAAKLGLRAGVLRSDAFSNLEPGVWVAFAGVHSSEAQAERTAGRLQRAGLAPKPYTRFVASR